VTAGHRTVKCGLVIGCLSGGLYLRAVVHGRHSVERQDWTDPGNNATFWGLRMFKSREQRLKSLGPGCCFVAVTRRWLYVGPRGQQTVRLTHHRRFEYAA
jgi:hypothetical protein